MKSQIFFILRVTCYLLLVTFIGCATVSVQRQIQIPSIDIQGARYISLKDLCKSQNFQWDYDTISRSATVKKGAFVAKFLPDSRYILVNSGIEEFSRPVRFYRGSPFVPYEFKEKVLDRFFVKEVIPPPERKIAFQRIKNIVIDPGHGGNDPGAIGRNGLREKDVNLDISRRLKNILESQGLKVTLTRQSDNFVSLQRRVNIANQANADLFISVHANASRMRAVNGFEVYYLAKDFDDTSRALSTASSVNPKGLDTSICSLPIKATLWDIIFTENRAESIDLARTVCKQANRDLGLRVLGIKGAHFYVLKGTQMPAVLIEVGFISHPEQEKFFANGFYRQQIAQAIARGIMDYCTGLEMAKGY